MLSDKSQNPFRPASTLISAIALIWFVYVTLLIVP